MLAIQTTAWFVWVGHGAPAPSGDDGLLLGVDTMPDSDSVSARGVLQARVTALLAANNPRNVIAVFDACFSGMNADASAPLIEGQQATLPLRRVVASPSVTTLSSSPTFAGAMPGLGRPAFSYALLGALRGWADANGDRSVTLNEAFHWTRNTLQLALKASDRLPSVSGGDSAAVLASNAGEPGPEIAAIVAGRCPAGTGWNGRRCDVSSADANPVEVATAELPKHGPRAPRELTQEEQIVEAGFRQEAMGLCMREGQTGWWFCTQERSLNENTFLVEYEALTEDSSLNDQIDVGDNYDTGLLFTIGGLGGMAAGALAFGIPLALEGPTAFNDSNTAPAIGIGGAAGILGVAFAGVGGMMLLTPRAENARSDQEVTEHNLTRGRAAQAARAFNDALYKKLRNDAGLEPRDPPDIELAATLPAQ